MVQNGWQNGLEDEDVWENIQNRTRRCKPKLQRWQKSTFCKADEEIKHLKKQLKIMIDSQNSNSTWADVKRVQKRIDDLWAQEELFWSQRSRVK